MEPKPAGPERNRQVAELRGDLKCIHETVCDCGISVNVPTCSEWEYPYSTDIATAFELSSDHMKISVFKSGEFGFCAHAVLYAEGPKMFRTGKVAGEHEGDYHDTKEKAIADAISGAYVKWKVTNNG